MAEAMMENGQQWGWRDSRGQNEGQWEWLLKMSLWEVEGPLRAYEKSKFWEGFVCLLCFVFYGNSVVVTILEQQKGKDGMVRVFRKQLAIILETHEEGSVALVRWNEKGQRSTPGKWNRSELGSRNSSGKRVRTRSLGTLERNEKSWDGDTQKPHIYILK